MGNIDHSAMPEHEYLYKSQEENDFVSTYKSCLCELNKLEQTILTLWYDANFNVRYTPEEIASKIKRPKLTPGQVKGIKIFSMKKIMNNPKMKKYKGLL